MATGSVVLAVGVGLLWGFWGHGWPGPQGGRQGSGLERPTGTPAAAPVPPPPPPVASVPFSPLSLPDWFDARLQFSHARVQALRGDNGEPLGVRVISVYPGLRPARLGVQPGDLLLRINGVSLTDPALFARVENIVAWTFLRADLIIVKMRRAGEEFSLAELGPLDLGAVESPGE